MPSQQLPKTFQPITADLEPQCASSYSKVISHEETLMAQRKSDDALAPVRVLGYILRENLGKKGIEQTARAIESCGVDRLDDLGKFYTKYLLKIFYRPQGPTPAPSENPSRPSFEVDCKHLVMFLMDPGNLSRSRARALAFERDKRRDVIMGDYEAHDESPEALQYWADTHRQPTDVRAAHIVPEYLANITQSDMLDVRDEELSLLAIPDAAAKENIQGAKVHRRSTPWTMLQYFVGGNTDEDLCLELGGNKIHSPTNVFLLQYDCHCRFGELRLWFELLDEENRKYRICVTKEHFRPKGPNGPVYEVVLPVKISDIPSEIAHMSGASGIFEKIYQTLDDSFKKVDVSLFLDSVTAKLELETNGPRVMRSENEADGNSDNNGRQSE